MLQWSNMQKSLLSDQVSRKEIDVIIRELQGTLSAGVVGDVVEFGCYVGTTSVFLADSLKGSPRKLWLYDSFSGLPEKTHEDVSPTGEQFRPGELLATRKQLEKNLRHVDRGSFVIKKAWFSDLTPDDIPNEISFAFLDGDYYRSILDPLALIWPRLSPDACVVVDDYANEALPGAAQAVNEWAARYDLSVKTEQSLAIFHK